jgi:DNA polymerase III alpha subunit
MGDRSIMSFTEQFTDYQDCAPPGVKLPEIKIEKKYYEMLEASEDISNLDFLRKLCHKGVYDRGIDKLKNKKEYFERAKSELKILDGFVSNWGYKCRSGQVQPFL